MSRRFYVILIPLAGSDMWFEVARCDSASAAGEVVRVLCLNGFNGYCEIKVSVVVQEMGG